MRLPSAGGDGPVVEIEGSVEPELGHPSVEPLLGLLGAGGVAEAPAQHAVGGVGDRHLARLLRVLSGGTLVVKG
jgi:hypothetical protein